MTLHGWYSKKAADFFGYMIYKTPEGENVNVTNVTVDEAGALCQWPDREYVGIVTEPVKGIEDSINFDEQVVEDMSPEEIKVAFVHIGMTLLKCAEIFKEHADQIRRAHASILIHNEALKIACDQDQRFLGMIDILEERIKALEERKTITYNPSEN